MEEENLNLSQVRDIKGSGSIIKDMDMENGFLKLGNRMWETGCKERHKGMVYI